MTKAIIIFTKVPIEGETKTRLMPGFSKEECVQFHTCCLKDIFYVCNSYPADIIVSYLGNKHESRLRHIFGRKVKYKRQVGKTLGERMYWVMSDALKTYDSCILIGTDVPELRRADIKQAFSTLKNKDIVLGPTADGGYYLVGMKKPIKELFEAKTYGHKQVLFEAISSTASSYLIGLGTVKHDIDTPEDVRGYYDRLKHSHCKLGRLTYTEEFLMRRQSVSIIIPFYKEKKRIKALQRHLYPVKNQCEIIFVGATTDDKEKILPCFIHLTSEKGRAKQMNAGAMKSHGDILFFLHSDSILPSHALYELRLVMLRHLFGAFGIRFSSNSKLMCVNEFLSNLRMKRGIIFGDQGIFIDRNLFFEIGMFPDLPIMEDYQISRTIRSMGIRPGFTKHHMVTSDRRYPKGVVNKLILMAHMANLRHRYRKGEDPKELMGEYQDVR